MSKLAHIKPLTNRSAADSGFALPADGFVQLVPLGDAPNLLGDKPIIQVIDRAALEGMYRDLLERAHDMLIDDDHLSHRIDMPTDANGWHLPTADNLVLRDDGLYGSPRWTALGRDKLLNGVKRYISPEFDPASLQHLGGNRYRVTRLTGLALTNRPNFQELQKSLTNSGRSSRPADNPEVTNMHKTLLALALGLPETDLDTLDETTLRAKVQELLDAQAAAKAAAAEAETLANREADDFIKTHAAILTNKEVSAHVRETYLTNRVLAVSLVNGMINPAPVKKEPLHNRASPVTPKAGEPDAAAEHLANRRRVHAEGVMKNRQCSWATAWAEAEQSVTE